MQLPSLNQNVTLIEPDKCDYLLKDFLFLYNTVYWLGCN